MARQAQLEARNTILGTFSDRSGATRGSVQHTGALASGSAPVPAMRERRKPTPVLETFGLRLRGEPDANEIPQRTSEQGAPKVPLRERIAHLQQSLAAL